MSDDRILTVQEIAERLAADHVISYVTISRQVRNRIERHVVELEDRYRIARKTLCGKEVSPKDTVTRLDPAIGCRNCWYVLREKLSA